VRPKKVGLARKKERDGRGCEGALWPARGRSLSRKFQKRRNCPSGENTGPDPLEGRTAGLVSCIWERTPSTPRKPSVQRARMSPERKGEAKIPRSRAISKGGHQKSPKNPLAAIRREGRTGVYPLLEREDPLHQQSSAGGASGQKPKTKHNGVGACLVKAAVLQRKSLDRSVGHKSRAIGLVNTQGHVPGAETSSKLHHRPYCPRKSSSSHPRSLKFHLYPPKRSSGLGAHLVVT